MDLEKYDRFLVLDLEATCCDRQTIPTTQMEIIEIGAVMLKAEHLTTISEFQTFIKPVRHPVLTEFCQQLTSITQDLVDNAPNYQQAIAQFKAWLYQYDNFVFGSWGDYDRKQFEQDSQFHRIPYPIGSEHINLKKLFTANQSLKKRYGMAEALKLADIKLIGTHHRGIDDARNIARLMPYILGRKKIDNPG
ncbi:MAG: exonuclease domain-containing protein [Cyanosarcina radialis HA8281-LM2]|jgi:inhibitor of KinA sporulation pathway (predicted exonuclease)|nr:exonuclease domain-containing protein [Cyanosarcina radialis HA8281-LM2]